MKLGLIGAGRTAAVMGGFFHRKGFELVGYASRTYASALENARITGSRAWEDPVGRARACDILLLSMADDAIADNARALAQNGVHAKLCGMFSGALSSADLAPLYKAGNTVFSLHPPYSFPDKSMDPARLDGITFTLEGAGQGMDRLRQSLQTAGIAYREIRPADKPRYHAAACACANYIVSLVKLAEDLLAGTDISPDIFAPMAQAALENAFMCGPQAALTGPIVRGDADTLRRQLAAMPAGKTKDIYTALGRYTADWALTDRQIQDNVKEALGNETGDKTDIC